MLEARESLVGKTHDEEAHKAKDHCVSMCERPRVTDAAEVLPQADRQQVDRSPDTPKSENGSDTGDEKGTINRVPDRAFRCCENRSRLARDLIQFVQQSIERDAVQARKPTNRLAWALRSTTAFQSVAIENRACSRIAFDHVGKKHFGSDFVVHRLLKVLGLRGSGAVIRAGDQGNGRAPPQA